MCGSTALLFDCSALSRSALHGVWQMAHSNSNRSEAIAMSYENNASLHHPRNGGILMHEVRPASGYWLLASPQSPLNLTEQAFPSNVTLFLRPRARIKKRGWR